MCQSHGLLNLQSFNTRAFAVCVLACTPAHMRSAYFRCIQFAEEKTQAISYMYLRCSHHTDTLWAHTSSVHRMS
jgi:hypothetical protein